jgi:tetratricopeptide (TPR) repeat protein
MREAITLFKKSVALDSGNIYSYAEIMECYRSLYSFAYISYQEFLNVIDPIMSAVRQANQTLDIVQILYCDLKMADWKFAEAATYCRRALAINSNSLKGRLRYSDLLLQTRNFTAALEQLERTMIVDPLSPLIYKRIGRVFYMMGDHNNAISYLNDALELEPGSHEALILRGAVYLDMGRLDLALEDFAGSLRTQRHPETLAMMGAALARQGNRERAEDLLRTIEAEADSRRGHSVMLAHVHLALGRKELVYKILEQGYEQHDPDLRALTYDRRWMEIRHESRFKSLIKRVGLPTLRDRDRELAQ